MGNEEGVGVEEGRGEEEEVERCQKRHIEGKA